jgi:outer membrane protein OmpA-like peptidoglycan-associated protein
MKKLIVMIMLLSTTIVVAQKSFVRKGDKYFSELAYYDAISMYEMALKRNVDTLSVASKLGVSYFKNMNYERSSVFLGFLFSKKKATSDELLKLVVSLYAVGHRDQALEALNAIPTQQSKELRNLLEQTDSNFDVSLVSGVNTTASEMYGFMLDNQVAIVSSRRKSAFVKRINSWTGDYYYSLSVDNKKVSGLKSKYNVGPACFGGGYLYFSKNEKPNKKGVSNMNIYRAAYHLGAITKVEKLYFNSSEFSCLHPSIDDKGRLFFASDKPGGFGGYDLYYVDLEKRSEPKNLGSVINTESDEVFPHWNGFGRVLFFSSHGHFGYGGLDNFVAFFDNQDKANKVANLGEDINSSYDDFGYNADPLQKNGFFTSNRPSMGSDDVFKFIQKSPYVSGEQIEILVLDAITKKPIEGVTVGIASEDNLTDKDGIYKKTLVYNGSFDAAFSHAQYEPKNLVISNPNTTVELFPLYDYVVMGVVRDKKDESPIAGARVEIRDRAGKVYSGVSGADGVYRVDIPMKFGDVVDFGVLFSLDGYVNNTIPLVQKLDKMEPILLNGDLVKIEVGKTDLADVIQINPIYFDYNKWDIRADAAAELDKIVRVMKENPGMVIELGSHTDSRGTAEYNMRLSDRRAKASADYIISKGISADRIYGRGYGMSRLKISNNEINALAANLREEAHQKNRRTEFIIVRMN